MTELLKPIGFATRDGATSLGIVLHTGMRIGFNFPEDDSLAADDSALSVFKSPQPVYFVGQGNDTLMLIHGDPVKPQCFYAASTQECNAAASAVLAWLRAENAALKQPS